MSPVSSSPPAPFIAHKFGGSSLADATRIRHVVDLVLARDERQIVVVSAMQGVTDALIALAQKAARRDEGWRGDLAALRERHTSTALTLLGDHAPALVAPPPEPTEDTQMIALLSDLSRYGNLSAEELRRFLASSAHEDLPDDVMRRLNQTLEELGP